MRTETESVGVTIAKIAAGLIGLVTLILSAGGWVGTLSSDLRMINFRLQSIDGQISNLSVKVTQFDTTEADLKARIQILERLQRFDPKP